MKNRSNMFIAIAYGIAAIAAAIILYTVTINCAGTPDVVWCRVVS